MAIPLETINRLRVEPLKKLVFGEIRKTSEACLSNIDHLMNDGLLNDGQWNHWPS